NRKALMPSVIARDLDKWWSDARYDRFRAAFQALKRATAVSDRKIHRRCEAIAEAHVGFWVPSLSTIERFGEASVDVQNTLRGKPRSLSCLLVSVGELFPDAADIGALACEFADSFDLAAEIAAPSIRQAPPARRTYTRAALDDILAAIGNRTANKANL